MAVSSANDLNPPALLVLLADGRVQSGEHLARQLGVSRAAIWKGVERLRERGVEVEAVARRGYRLPSPVELLDPELCRGPLSAANAARLRNLDILFEVDSTNTRLLSAPPPPYGLGDVASTEMQQAGRGRRGRTWIAPFGASLALSLSWCFPDMAGVGSALSLSVGVAVARALARAGAIGIGLKWPNDIWFADRKVGGVLIEMRAESSGPAHVVIGVGLNVGLADAARVRISAAGGDAASVADACATPPSRNFIAGAIIDELLSMLVVFEQEGFAASRNEWLALDALRDRPARVLMGDNVVPGIARGVDAHGALCLESAGRVEAFVSGEVSLRLGGDAN